MHGNQWVNCCHIVFSTLYYFHMNIYCPPSFPLSKIYHVIVILDIDVFLDADNMADNRPVDDSDDDDDDEVAQVKKKVSI